MGVGEGVKVGESVSDGVTPGGRVGLGVPVGAGETGPIVQAARSIASSPVNIRFVVMEIFIIEKRKRVNACESKHYDILRNEALSDASESAQPSH